MVVTKLELTMILLPVVFMVHEYEEIIMFKHWLNRNRDELKRRFPKFDRFLARRGFFDYSTATFAVGTAHEFLLISLISFCAVWQGAYQLWFAAFAGHSVHLLAHIAQWVIYRKYVPVIITTILTLPYCIYGFAEFSKASILSPLQMFLWSVVRIILTMLSLLSAFFFMSMFQRWQDKH